jgi:hypothetical protein
MHGISWLAAEPLDSQERSCSMELFAYLRSPPTSSSPSGLSRTLPIMLDEHANIVHATRRHTWSHSECKMVLTETVRNGVRRTGRGRGGGCDCDSVLLISMLSPLYWSLVRTRCLALTTWARVPYLWATLHEKTHWSYQKHQSVSLFTGRHLLRVRYVTFIKPSLRTGLAW